MLTPAGGKDWAMFVALVFLACLGASPSHSAAPRLDGWTVEPGVDPPSYAVTEPTSSNLNVDTIALICEEATNSRIVQLQLYLSDGGPLAPKGVAPSALKRYPRAQIVIDKHVYPAGIYFADDYVLVADAERDRFPMLSDSLLDAMARGETMTLRFDLAEKDARLPPAFDGEAVIDLKAGRGGQAVNEVRRCAAPAADTSAGVAQAVN